MIFGLFFSVIGYVFSKVILDDVLIPYARWLHTLPSMLAKPLGLCAACFSGQLTLWGLLPFLQMEYTSFLTYFGIISINIILARLYEKIGL